MSCDIVNNLQRQEDEMAAISSIYDETEFFYARISNCTKCSVSVYPKLLKKLEIKFTSICSSNGVPNDSIFVEYLPPIRLYIYLPDTYPSERPPHFYLSIIWLAPWEISSVCQKFDEIWEENHGNEIIFLWLNFLQNDLFSFLNIREFLDVSFLHLIHTSRDDATLRLAELSDPRAQNGALLLDAKQLLILYNKQQHEVQFFKNTYTCDICLEEHSGQRCIELENCKHVYCKSCMEKHVGIKISEHICKLLCPTVDCKCQISENDVKTLCPDLFYQYEELMLRVTLDTMDDIVYCPQISCQYPVIKSPDDNAPICPNCNYCFCVYCRKMYHGQAPCEMTSTDTVKLINEYKNSTNDKKKTLEKKYGKRQMQSVEKYLTTEYLQDNAKSCPKCHSFISKIDGCNKMTCGHCRSIFCWLCNEQIYGYEHFNRDDSPCYGLLFQGMETDNIVDEVFNVINHNVIDDMIQFFANVFDV